MKFADLPHFASIKARTDVKVLRHRGKASEDLWGLHRNGLFEAYQSHQGWDVFTRASYLISFIAEQSRYARFAGVWQVTGRSKLTNGEYRYRTNQLAGFEDLVGRLIVDWGRGTRSWTQWLHGPGNKDVFEIWPPNYVRDFPGFYDFTLAFDELAEIVRNPESHREWKRMLSAFGAIYIITDQFGQQYVGSASGRGGIWARWSSYVDEPSGGNKKLGALLRGNPGAFKGFRFSLLRVLEAEAPREDVLTQEAQFKRKLGSRAIGLNAN